MSGTWKWGAACALLLVLIVASGARAQQGAPDERVVTAARLRAALPVVQALSRQAQPDARALHQVTRELLAMIGEMRPGGTTSTRLGDAVPLLDSVALFLDWLKEAGVPDTIGESGPDAISLRALRDKAIETCAVLADALEANSDEERAPVLVQRTTWNLLSLSSSVASAREAYAKDPSGWSWREPAAAWETRFRKGRECLDSLDPADPGRAKLARQMRDASLAVLDLEWWSTPLATALPAPPSGEDETRRAEHEQRLERHRKEVTTRADLLTALIEADPAGEALDRVRRHLEAMALAVLELESPNNALGFWESIELACAAGKGGGTEWTARRAGEWQGALTLNRYLILRVDSGRPDRDCKPLPDRWDIGLPETERTPEARKQRRLFFETIAKEQDERIEVVLYTFGEQVFVQRSPAECGWKGHLVLPGHAHLLLIREDNADRGAQLEAITLWPPRSREALLRLPAFLPPDMRLFLGVSAGFTKSRPEGSLLAFAAKPWTRSRLGRAADKALPGSDEDRKKNVAAALGEREDIFDQGFEIQERIDRTASTPQLDKAVILASDAQRIFESLGARDESVLLPSPALRDDAALSWLLRRFGWTGGRRLPLWREQPEPGRRYEFFNVLEIAVR